MTKYYIASGLDNKDAVRALRDVLNAAGWEHTYDWTSKQGDTLAETAQLEIEGVYMADVVIVLLPGGRGTHTELGCALGQADCYVQRDVPRKPRVVIYSVWPDLDFTPGNGRCCVFYHHPLVERFDNYAELVSSLIGEVQ